MPEAKWERAKEIFAQAVEKAEHERQAFLAQACEEDGELLQLVQALLQADAEAGSFIEKPVMNLPPWDESYIGRHVGAYKILSLLGRGGMGAVYLAARADEQFQKQVAIKLIKRGMDSEDILARFRHERQILASLDHPNVARLLDGGMTEEGLPYFVMEYIEGKPIDAFCDDRKLNTSERLQLFRQVCAAAQYAHQNLIVHRDLKPSNILVTTEGVPKLLDFGIAKLLNPNFAGLSLQLSKAGMQIMTPEYASPEQVRGEPINTASDVYSLGVLLYELLTGHRPYRLQSRVEAEIKRVVCEQEPEKPSTAISREEEVMSADGLAATKITPQAVSAKREGRPESLRKRLAGDIDNIVLMALRKEPQRRYASVEQFAEDVQRHLQGLPVRARKDTFSYRAQKFARRHRMGLSAATITVLALVGGLIGVSWQAQIARSQRDLAVRTASTMINELALGLSQMSGPTEAHLGLLQKATKIFDELAGSTSDARDLIRMRAEANRILSQSYRTLGDLDNALQRARTGAELAHELAQSREATRRERAIAAVALLDLGHAEKAAGKNNEAHASHEKGLKIAEQLVAQSDSLTERDYRLIALLLNEKGDWLWSQGDYDQARVAYERSYDYRGRITAPDSGKAVQWYDLAVALERVGNTLEMLGQADSSCAKYREALDLHRRIAEIAGGEPFYALAYSNMMLYLGWCAQQRENWAEAAARYEEGIALQRRLVQKDPHNVHYVSSLSGGAGTMAGLLVLKKDYAGSLPWYREALSLSRQLLAQSEDLAAASKQTAELAHMYAGALIETKKFSEAEAALAEASELIAPLLQADTANMEYLNTQSFVLSVRGDLERARGRHQRSLRDYEQALALRKKVATASQGSHDWQITAESYYKLGLAQRNLGQREAAMAAWLEGKKILFDLRAKGELEEATDGARVYWPAIEKALQEAEK